MEITQSLELVDNSLINSLPSEIEPTMQNAWSAFRLLTQQLDNANRDQAWFAIINHIAAGVDQIDFTANDWRRVIELLTGTITKQNVADNATFAHVPEGLSLAITSK